MCGRFVRTSSPEDLARFFDAVILGERVLATDHNVAPSTDIWVVVEDRERRCLTPMHWGLVPPWAKDPKIGNRMINARAETVAVKNSFRRAYRNRRCLIPVDGFYEWKTVPGQKRKQPYFIHDPTGAPYAFAGLWERWRDPQRDIGEELRSATMITVDSNEPMSAVHHRMPVILEPDDWDLWLADGVDDPEILDPLLVPSSPERIAMHPVGPEVGNVRNNGPGLIEPVSIPDSLF